MLFWRVDPIAFADLSEVQWIRFYYFSRFESEHSRPNNEWRTAH